MGAAVAAEGIATAFISASGLVVLTHSMSVWAVPDMAIPRPVRLAGVCEGAACRGGMHFDSVPFPGNCIPFSTNSAPQAR